MASLLLARATRKRAPTAILSLVPLIVACGAVYPEVQTPVNSAPPGAKMDPPPPEDIMYVQFASAQIPSRTRDGRKWDAVGGEAPDVFAKLIVDNREVIVTPVESNTLTPTWPDQVRANYRIRPGAEVTVELWDSNAMVNHPVCSEKVRDLHSSANAGGSVEVDCESGARLRLQVEPAHARVGIGMYYELRQDSVYVTRVLGQSPAARAGLAQGDQIVKIEGQNVSEMEEGKPQSLINANASVGVKVSIKQENGKTQDLTLKNGPIYPLVDDDVKVDQ